MDKKETVDINGRQYDPITGLPLGAGTPKAASATHEKPTVHSIHAHSIHSTMQKSRTLRRSSLSKPEKPVSQHAIVQRKTPPVANPTIAKSRSVAKFAPGLHPGKRVMDIGPARHPAVVKALAKVDAKKAPVEVKPAQVLKREIIAEAVKNTHKETKQPKRGFRHPTIASILTASFALLILGGYLTYLNMPSLSVRVAAAQAGIDASYPSYHPDGYSLKGPVAYDQGEVRMQFAANAGPQNFVIKQQKSSWDSDAVRDNFVEPKVGSSYATYSDHGLTIYTFDGGTAWVNGGILYTIDGDARLSSEQIRHIATSFM